MKISLTCIIILTIVASTISALISYPGFSSTIPYYIGYSDINIFTQKAIDPTFPYIGKDIEYPVITGVFIHTMGLFGNNFYYITSSVFLTLFAVITSIFLYKIVETLKLDKKKLIYFYILTPTFLFFTIYNWDIIAVMFVSMSFYFFIKEKPVKSSVFLALAVASKLYPAVFLIPFLFKTKREKRSKFLVVFVLVFLFVNSYFMLSNFNGWLFTYNFHNTRSANYDSIFGVIQYFIPSISSSFVNIVSLALFGISYILLVILRRKRDIFELCFMSILLFLFFNKVFSPQFLLWTLMFFVLIRFNKKIFYSLEASNFLVFFFILFWWFAYKDLVEILYIAFLFVIIRHVILFYMIYKMKDSVIRHKKR